MNQKQKVYSLISVLLQYPEEDWKETEGLYEEISRITEPQISEHLRQFCTYIEETPFEELCQTYVYTFDFYEKATLYLTHSVFKDNRERGEVLIQLRRKFYQANLEFLSDELPDYLPLILEFAAIAPDGLTEEVLNLHKRSIQNLELELNGIDSPYRHLLVACLQNMSSPIENEKVS